MFCLTGTNRLSADVFPPIVLDGSYEIGLVDLYTYNSIPNIEKDVNNRFYYGNKYYEFPEGSYELKDISRMLKKHLNVQLISNTNTLKCELFSTEKVDFTKPYNIGSLFGFGPIVTEPNRWYYSSRPVDVNRVNTIRVECNIVRGSYLNGVEGHVLHEFFPRVPSGYKIMETPPTIIYMPVNTQTIDHISLRIVDQDGRAVNFRGETITVRLNLRRRNNVGF